MGCRQSLTHSFVYVQDKIGLVGFEPTASCTRGRRSTKLSHSPKLLWSRRIDNLSAPTLRIF